MVLQECSLMLNKKEKDGKELCRVCGQTIPDVCLSRQLGPFQVHSPLMKCPSCIYDEMFRKVTTVRCPFRTPFLRRKKSGALPVEIQNALDEAIAQAKEEHNHAE